MKLLLLDDKLIAKFKKLKRSPAEPTGWKSFTRKAEWLTRSKPNDKLIVYWNPVTGDKVIEKLQLSQGCWNLTEKYASNDKLLAFGR